MYSVLLALMLMVCGTAWAGVTGEVVGQAMDENGNIVVKVAYEIDGVPVDSPYPKENGRPIFVFRMAYTNVVGMTQEQIGAFIDQNVKQYCEALLQRKANSVENAKISLAPFVGRKVTVNSSDFQVSPVKVLTLTTAGKTGEKVLTPPPEKVSLADEIAEIKTSLVDAGLIVEKTSSGVVVQ